MEKFLIKRKSTESDLDRDCKKRVKPVTDLTE